MTYELRDLAGRVLTVSAPRLPDLAVLEAARVSLWMDGQEIRPAMSEEYRRYLDARGRSTIRGGK